MDVETRLKRLRFRAWHRGTREADMLVGGFFDTYAAAWTPGEIDLFETLIEERETARRARDWTRADALRGRLEELGILVEDTPGGPRWKRSSAP